MGKRETLLPKLGDSPPIQPKRPPYPLGSEEDLAELLGDDENPSPGPRNGAAAKSAARASASRPTPPLDLEAEQRRFQGSTSLRDLRGASSAPSQNKRSSSSKNRNFFRDFGGNPRKVRKVDALTRGELLRIIQRKGLASEFEQTVSPTPGAEFEQTVSPTPGAEFELSPTPVAESHAEDSSSSKAVVVVQEKTSLVQYPDTGSTEYPTERELKVARK